MPPLILLAWQQLWPFPPVMGKDELLPLLLYVFLFLLIRIVTRPENALVIVLEFFVILLFSQRAQIALLGDESSVWGAVIGASLLVVLSTLLRLAATPPQKCARCCKELRFCRCKSNYR